MTDNEMTFKVSIEGMAPILFNRFPDEENPDEKSKTPSGRLNQDEQVKQSLYFDGDKIYQPAEHIVGAMVKAGAQFKLKGKQTYKDVVKGGVFVEPMKIIHENQKYINDWRSVVIKATRGRIMKGRGRLDKWSLSFNISCIDPRATEKDLKDILVYAGKFIGIGDYRPRYGRFEVKSFKK